MEYSIIDITNKKVRFDNSRFKRILHNIERYEKCSLRGINFIICSDSYIHSVNKRYLHHNYPTDVISFNYSELKLISGDIFVSIDTALYNSRKFNRPLNEELFRYMIHGLLHNIGYDDKTSKLRLNMRRKEDYYLQLS